MQLKTNKLKQPFFTKLVLAVLSVMCCALAASAQNVKGKITDDENLGMPGVSISLKGTATVALSDSLGN